jgi:hypothetical protein
MSNAANGIFGSYGIAPKKSVAAVGDTRRGGAAQLTNDHLPTRPASATAARLTTAT